MQYYVYILKCADGTLYTGKTVDIEKRLKAHNGIIKGGARYTSGRRPVILVYYEKFATVTEALKREYEVKKLSKIEKMLLLDKG